MQLVFYVFLFRNTVNRTHPKTAQVQASTEAGSYIWSDLATDENIQARYAVEVKNRFQALKNEVLDQSALDYDTFVQSSAEAAERCLRKVPRQKKKVKCLDPRVEKVREEVEEAHRN